MPFSDIFAQSSGSRFDDPAVEEYYQRDRAQRDALRACRVQITVAIMAIVLGTLVTIVSLVRHSPVSFLWIVLRFGFVVPLLLASSFVVLRPWGQRHLQWVLGLGVGLMAGAQSLGWFRGWRPGKSIRCLLIRASLTF